jgi:hypothetical protein
MIPELNDDISPVYGLSSNALAEERKRGTCPGQDHSIYQQNLTLDTVVVVHFLTMVYTLSSDCGRDLYLGIYWGSKLLVRKDLLSGYPDDNSLSCIDNKMTKQGVRLN